VKEDVGKCAIQRGPIVYCAEEIDNPGIFESMQISSTTDKWQVKKDNMLNGIYRITDGNYNLIPYYSWDNREPSQMKVWIDNK
ncbi:MAG: glycoside hydrolase family 127 protein, partial [Bacteroidaceae bacterium]|nr:glycoside hydrolase family 127 protein [Bacteroidaceae bacterium]